MRQVIKRSQGLLLFDTNVIHKKSGDIGNLDYSYSLEIDDVCTCSDHRLEEQRKELESLKEEQLRCEAKRLAQLAEQEANKKEIAQEQAKLKKLSKDAELMKEQVQKTKSEIVKLGASLEQQAHVQLKEQKELVTSKQQIEKEKQRAREERQKLRKQKQQQKEEEVQLKRKQQAEEEELKNEQKSLLIQKQQNAYLLQEHKREVEKQRDLEKDVFHSEVENMRKLVHREVAHIRSMAGLDIVTAKDQKDMDNENEALEGLEEDRLQLKDLTDPLAPVLPDKYLQPSQSEADSQSEAGCQSEAGNESEAKDQNEADGQSEVDGQNEADNIYREDYSRTADDFSLLVPDSSRDYSGCGDGQAWERIDRKFERLAMEEKPVGQWRTEEIDRALQGLGDKVREVHGRVCQCLENKYSSVLSIDDKTQGLTQQVIDQFTQISPLFEQLEKIVAEKGSPQQSEKLKDYDHSLSTIDNLLQIHEVIQTIEKTMKARDFLVAIESLDALYNLMANLDVENDAEVRLKKCLQVELCLLREKLMFSLNEAWNQMLKWTLPTESRRLALRPRTVTLKVKGISEDHSTITCTVQAMNSVNILESRLKILCDNIMMYFIEPVVQDKNTLVQVIDNPKEQYLCVVIHPPTSRIAIPAQQVFQKLEQVFRFIHKPMHDVVVQDRQHKNSESGTTDMVQKIGKLICKRVFECVYKDCLSRCMPKTSRQFENFNEIMSATEAFQDLLHSLKFLSDEEATLMDYLNNVNKLFANIKGQEMLKRAHELLGQELSKCLSVSSQHPLGMQCGEGGEIVAPEDFVQQCKETAGTLNLSLPNCQISCSVRSLMSLAYSTMKEALGSTCGPEAATHLANSLHSMFELYCDIVPSYQKDKLKTVPLLAGLHHNNCMFVAHHLITLDKCLHKKGSKNTRESPLQDLIPRIRKMGNEHFTEHLNIKKEELCDKLIEAQGFECVADDEAESAQGAVKHMLHFLRAITQMWRDVLPTNVYCRATGSLLNAAIDEIIESVLEIEEFSVDDCEYLKEALTPIPQAAVELFKLEGTSSNPQVALHENAPSWLRFTEIIMMLGSGLQDISDRWADGKGPLAMYLSSEEVKGCVMAMFENTSKREKVLREITKPSVASLPLPAFPMKRMRSSPL